MCQQSSFRDCGLPRRSKRALYLRDALLVPAVERPLFDAFGSDEPGSRQDSQVFTGRRLADTELFRDKHSAHAIASKVAVRLGRKVSAGILEPKEDLQTSFIRECLHRVDG
jgi:hypothetical protein